MGKCFGFDSQKAYINRHLKSYDYELYAQRNRDDILCIYRRRKREIVAAEWDGFKLLDFIDSPEFVFALTDTWKTNGTPREWGADYVLSRLREMDFWSDPEMFSKMERENDKINEIKRKDFRNETEAALLDNKRALQKSFGDINTANMSMREKRKEKQDKKLGVL